MRPLDFPYVLVCLVLALPALLLPACKSTDPRDVDDPTLRVMSYNVRVANFGDTLLGNSWRGRRGDVVKLIREFDPDLFGTQEGKADQVKYIRKRTKWFAVHGAGRDNGRSWGEYCAIYYRKVRFDFLDGGHIWFNDSGKPGRATWGSVFPRMASWALLDDKFTGQMVLAVNTHLDVFSGESRVRSARMLRELIGRFPDARVILTGDFNCDVGSEPFHILTEKRRLLDTYTAAGHEDGDSDGTTPGFLGSRDGDRIDWILVSPDIHVVDADIVHDKPLFDGHPSDHFPVTATLLLPEMADEQ